MEPYFKAWAVVSLLLDFALSKCLPGEKELSFFFRMNKSIQNVPNALLA
jgi:hypothetical protein